MENFQGFYTDYFDSWDDCDGRDNTALLVGGKGSYFYINGAAGREYFQQIIPLTTESVLVSSTHAYVLSESFLVKEHILIIFDSSASPVWNPTAYKITSAYFSTFQGAYLVPAGTAKFVILSQDKQELYGFYLEASTSHIGHFKTQTDSKVLQIHYVKESSHNGLELTVCGTTDYGGFFQYYFEYAAEGVQIANGKSKFFYKILGNSPYQALFCTYQPSHSFAFYAMMFQTDGQILRQLGWHADGTVVFQKKVEIRVGTVMSIVPRSFRMALTSSQLLVPFAIQSKTFSTTFSKSQVNIFGFYGDYYDVCDTNYSVEDSNVSNLNGVLTLAFDHLGGDASKFMFTPFSQLGFSNTGYTEYTIYDSPYANYQYCEVKLNTPAIANQQAFNYIGTDFVVNKCTESTESFCGMPITHSAQTDGVSSFHQPSMTFTLRPEDSSTKNLKLQCQVYGAVDEEVDFTVTGQDNTPSKCNNVDDFTFLNGITFPITVYQGNEDTSVKAHFDYPQDGGQTIDFEITAIDTKHASAISALSSDGATLKAAPTSCSEAGIVPVTITFKDSTNRNGFECEVPYSAGIEYVFEGLNTAPSYPGSTSPIEYDIGSPTPLTITLDTFTDTNTADTITHSLSVDNNPNALSLPFVKSATVSASTGGDLTIESSDNLDAGTYEIKWKGTDDCKTCCVSIVIPESTEITIQLTLKPYNSPPIVDPSPISDQTVEVYSQKVLAFPIVTDVDISDRIKSVKVANIDDSEFTYVAYSVDLAAQTVTFRPDNNSQENTYNIKLVFEDEPLTYPVFNLDPKTDDSPAFRLIVTPFNHVPVLDEIQLRSFKMFNYEEVRFPLSNFVSDQDAFDSFTLTATADGIVKSFITFIPSIITRNTDTALYFRPNDPLHVGIYVVCVQATDNDTIGQGQNKMAEYCIDMEIIGVNNPPEFDKNIIDSSYEILQYETMSFFLPSATDEDPGDILVYSLIETSGKEISWIKNDGVTAFIAPNSLTKDGTYSLRYQVEDNDSENSGSIEKDSINFSVKVKKATLLSDGTIMDQEIIAQEVGQSFAEILLQSAQAPKEGEPPIPTLESISKQGRVKISWNTPIFINDNFKTIVNQALSLKVDSYITNDYEEIKGWNCTTVTEGVLYLDLNFTKPEEVSAFYVSLTFSYFLKKPDFLSISFDETKTKFFVSQETKQAMEDDIILRLEIPKQTDLSAAIKFLLENHLAFIQSSTTFFVVNLTANLLMSASMNLIWSLLNALQIMVCFPLLNLDFPANAFQMSLILNKIASLDLVPMDSLNKIFLEFNPNSKPYNINFFNYGYETSNFIMNSQLLFWLFQAWFWPAIIFWILSKIIKEGPLYIIVAKVYEKLFWNSIIRFSLESYVDFFICAMINVKKDLLWNESGEVLSSLLSIFSLLLFFILPIIMHFTLTKYFYKFKSSKFESKFGDIYEGLKIYKRQAVLFNFYFVLRRIIVVCAIFFIQELVIMQVVIFNIGSFIIWTYIFTVRPFKKELLNRIELMNESIILILSYVCLFFTGIVYDYEFKLQIGWLYVWIIVGCIFFNMSIIVNESLIKPFYYRVLFKRKLKEIKKRSTNTNNQTLVYLLGHSMHDREIYLPDTESIKEFKRQRRLLHGPKKKAKTKTVKEQIKECQEVLDNTSQITVREEMQFKKHLLKTFNNKKLNEEQKVQKLFEKINRPQISQAVETEIVDKLPRKKSRSQVQIHQKQAQTIISLGKQSKSNVKKVRKVKKKLNEAASLRSKPKRSKQAVKEMQEEETQDCDQDLGYRDLMAFEPQLYYQ